MELITIVHQNKIEYIPIVYEFLKKITHHILVYDENEKDKLTASNLKDSIEKLNIKYGHSSTIDMIEIDEDSKQDMENIAKELRGEREDLYLNGAGADVALFTIFSSIVLRNKGQVIAYDKEDNSYNFITQNGFSNKKIEHNMNIEDFLIVMGEVLLDERNKEKIVKNKEALEIIFSDTKRMFKVRYLLKHRKTNELRKRYPKMMEELKKLHIVDDDYTIKGQEGFTRFGLLFEEFVYLQLEGFTFDDIKVGAEILFDQKQGESQNIDVSNEFDILTIHENKIGFIECKIGDSHDALGTIYKSDSVMEYFGESASSLIVNIERDKTPHFKKSKMNFGPTLLYRAKTKRVNVYNAFDFSKPAFNSKVSQAFGVEIKEAFEKVYRKDTLKSLQNKW